MSRRAETLLMQGHQARREHRLDDAKRILAEAVKAARLSKHEFLMARAFTELGRIERDLRETDGALRHYEEAAAIYRRLDESLTLAHTVRHIGDILRESGLLLAAKPCYRESLKIYRSHAETPPLDLANAIRGYALLQEEIGENQEAVTLWREARELYTVASVQAGVDEGDRRIERLSQCCLPGSSPVD
jgi:tetratricopeptide (TPR) repeat protein